MSERKEGESLEFQLRVVCVKMKMKFPCRMALEYQKNPITKEAPATDQSRFVFNETITLRGQGDGFAFQIMASLYTEKGTKYTSGSMKWLSAELLRSKGERLVIPLNKCVDPDAFCELVVEGVKDLKDSQLKLSRSSSKVLNSQERPDVVSPLPKKIVSERYLIGETRSQANFQALQGLVSDDKSPRDAGPKSQIFKTFTKSPNSKFSTIKYTTYNPNNQPNQRSEFPAEEAATHRTSFDQSQVYREGYLKLKEKFKRQSELLKEENRKMAALQANQNTLRLEMMKLRVKSEELQKQLSDKNEKVKALASQLTEFQKKDLDLAYVREQCNNLERKNKIQQDTIASMVADSNSLKKLMAQRSALDEKTIAALRQQLQLARGKVEEVGLECELQLKAKENIILTKSNDVQLRNETIERQKRLIKELEEQAEARIIDYERSLTAERNALQLKIDDLSLKISALEGDKVGLAQKNALLQMEIEKLNATVSSLEFGRKVLTEEASLRTAEITELKAARQKHGELVREHRFLEQQFATVRKSLQSSLQNKQIDLSELLKQYEEGKQRSDKIKADQQQKIKLLSTKSLEAEVTITQLNNSLDKSKRINQTLIRENLSLREQNRQIREDYKKIEGRYIALENQHSNFSHRNGHQTNTLRAALEKLKEERKAAQRQIDNLAEKGEKLSEALKNYAEKEGQWRIKQRHYEQRIQKEVSKAKEAVGKYESIIQDQKRSLADSTSAYDSLTQDHRALRKRANDLQFAAIRNRQATEKLKQIVSLNEERIATLQAHTKRKLEEEKQLKEQLGLLKMDLADRDAEIAKFKEKQLQFTSKATKQEQIMQFLNKDIAKLQKQTQQLTALLKSKEQSEERLRQELKAEREEVVKERMRSSKVEGDFQKFKEGINDIMRIEFTRILNTPSTTQKNTERLKESQVSIAKSQKSHKSKAPLDPAALSSGLLQKLQQTKSSLWKMVELNRFLKEQNVRLLTHSENESNKYEFAQLQLHRDIQLLQDQMGNLLSDKEAECQNYDQLLLDLNFRLKQKETENEDLRSEIAQYEAIVNGLKTDFETNNDLNDKKVASLKQTLSELQERIEYLNLNVACLEDKNHELEQKTIQQENQIIACKEMLLKSEKAALDLRESESRLLISEQSWKKEVKNLQQKYVQLEMLFNSEKEAREKSATLLEQEQRKCQKLNEFVNGLIAQKEAAIKSELQKSQQNNQLENQLFQMTHNRDLLQEEATSLKHKLEESKQQSKGLLKNVKSLEKQLAEQRSKHARCMQKVKERQSDLEIKKEYIKDLQQKYRELRDKNYKQIRQLSNELEDKNLIAINASKELNDKIIKVQTESRKHWEQAISLQEELEHFTQQLYQERDRLQDVTAEAARLKDGKIALEEELLSREFALQERGEEVRRLEEAVGELRLQAHNLQAQCESQEKQFNIHIQQLTGDYNAKLEETAKENAHNQTLLSDDARQLRGKSDALEQQLLKAQLELKTHLQEHSEQVASYQERLKKIEAERMGTIQVKNAEIKKAAEDGRVLQEQLREKQSQMRKLILQVQQRKAQEAELQAKLTQVADRAKNKEKVLQREIEGLKAREKLSAENKQKLLTSLHENETQIRKLITDTVKKLVESCCKTDIDRVQTAMKGLENNVSQSMLAAKLK